MNHWMQEDRAAQRELLQLALDEAQRFLDEREEAVVNPICPLDPWRDGDALPQEGIGAREALAQFQRKYGPYLPASSGPRSYGFIIGGNTPASLMGDWLTSLYDLNAFGLPQSVDAALEREAVAQLRELLGLPQAFTGQFVAGATLANTTALAVAREWAAQWEGKTAADGVYGLTCPTVLTGHAHGSVYKGLSILGLGRGAVRVLPCLPGTESVQVQAVEEYLKDHPDERCIVIANMGTATTGDMDDLPALAALKERYDFFLHVEAAVGAVAAASPHFRPLFAGMEWADSFVLDAHKWLNAPYDSAVVLVRGPELREYQYRVFAQADRVDGPVTNATPFTSTGPEGSRRWRALPVWFALQAYGQAGFAEMVERNCSLASRLAEELRRCPLLQVRNRVQLNIVTFTLVRDGQPVDRETLQRFADRLREKGETYLNLDVFDGVPVARGTICNWMVEEKDILRAAASIIETAGEVLGIQAD